MSLVRPVFLLYFQDIDLFKESHINIFSLNSKKMRVEEEKQRRLKDCFLSTVFSRNISSCVTFLEVAIKVPRYEMRLVSHQPHTGAVEKERGKLSEWLQNSVGG